jgi:hypothetical protein
VISDYLLGPIRARTYHRHVVGANAQNFLIINQGTRRPLSTENNLHARPVLQVPCMITGYTVSATCGVILGAKPLCVNCKTLSDSLLV